MTARDYDAYLIEQIKYENSDDPNFDEASAQAALASLRIERNWRSESALLDRYTTRLAAGERQPTD